MKKFWPVLLLTGCGETSERPETTSEQETRTEPPATTQPDARLL